MILIGIAMLMGYGPIYKQTLSFTIEKENSLRKEKINKKKKNKWMIGNWDTPPPRIDAITDKKDFFPPRGSITVTTYIK